MTSVVFLQAKITGTIEFHILEFFTFSHYLTKVFMGWLYPMAHIFLEKLKEIYVSFGR